MSMLLNSEPDSIGIVAGTFDDESVVPPPSAHIFLEEKAPWYELPEDGAERWQGWSE